MIERQVEDVTVEGDEAGVEISGAFPGETRSDVATSVREDGEWKVRLI